MFMSRSAFERGNYICEINSYECMQTKLRVMILAVCKETKHACSDRGIKVKEKWEN